LKYNRSYHPAFAWGRWIIFAAFLFLTIAVLTNIVPLPLQSIAVILIVATMVIGAVIGLMGGFKSFHRDAYPALLALVLIPVILLVIVYLLRR
jgi:hypothetical protein